jgi:Protein of unknown function (DUF2637)
MGRGLPGGKEQPITHEETQVQLPQLRRIRWAVRAALFLGVAASIAANVLHAQPNPISQTISAWPPLALLLTVELTSRIPMHRPLLATLRVTSTAVIAGIAAWVSYWHMKEVAVRYGETDVSAYLLPISVDGLIVVASVSLVELAGRIRMLEEARVAPISPAVAPVTVVQPDATAIASPPPVFQAPPAAPVVAAPVPATVGSISTATAVDETEFDEDFEDEELAPLSAGGSAHGTVRTPRSAPVSPAVGPVYVNGSASAARPAATRAAVSTPGRSMVTESTTPKPRRPVSETAQLADAIEAMQPGIGEDELAARLGITASRLRQVRREAEAKRASLRA